MDKDMETKILNLPHCVIFHETWRKCSDKTKPSLVKHIVYTAGCIPQAQMNTCDSCVFAKTNQDITTKLLNEVIHINE